MQPSKQLIQETKAIIRFYEFLRYDCGLKEADKLSAKESSDLLEWLTIRQEKG